MQITLLPSRNVAIPSAPGSKTWRTLSPRSKISTIQRAPSCSRLQSTLSTLRSATAVCAISSYRCSYASRLKHGLDGPSYDDIQLAWTTSTHSSSTTATILSTIPRTSVHPRLLALLLFLLLLPPVHRPLWTTLWRRKRTPPWWRIESSKSIWNCSRNTSGCSRNCSPRSTSYRRITSLPLSSCLPRTSHPRRRAHWWMPRVWTSLLTKTSTGSPLEENGSWVLENWSIYTLHLLPLPLLLGIKSFFALPR